MVAWALGPLMRTLTLSCARGLDTSHVGDASHVGNAAQAYIEAAQAHIEGLTCVSRG